MGDLGMRKVRSVVMCCLAALALAGCVIPRPEGSIVIPAPENLTEPVCIAPPAGNLLVGAWYILRKQAGVAGEIQTD